MLQTPGGLAQLGERLHGMQEVIGSTPLSSTIFKSLPFFVLEETSPWAVRRETCFFTRFRTRFGFNRNGT